MIKNRIESLIEREYLERVEEAKLPTYRYLA
jgi:cullin 3